MPRAEAALRRTNHPLSGDSFRRSHGYRKVSSHFQYHQHSNILGKKAPKKSERAGLDTYANVEAVNGGLGFPTGEPGAISADQVRYLLTAWPHDRVLEANALEVYALHVFGQLSRKQMVEWLRDMPKRDAFKVGEGAIQSTEEQIRALYRFGFLTRAEIGLDLC